MARLNIFAAGFILAVAFNFFAYSSDVLDINPDLKVPTIVEEIKATNTLQNDTLTFRFGQRVAGKGFHLNLLRINNKSTDQLTES